MADQLLEIARALGHPVRLHLLRIVGENGMGVTAAAHAAGVTKATAWHHLQVLLDAGLVVRARARQRGGGVVYRWGPTRWALTTVPKPADVEGGVKRRPAETWP